MERTVNNAPPALPVPTMTWQEHPYRACIRCDFGGSLLTKDGLIYICRRNPPHPFLNVVMTPQGPAFAQNEAWPRVAPTDWCGHWLQIWPGHEPHQQLKNQQPGNQA